MYIGYWTINKCYYNFYNNFSQPRGQSVVNNHVSQTGLLTINITQNIIIKLYNCRSHCNKNLYFNVFSKQNNTKNIIINRVTQMCSNKQSNTKSVRINRVTQKCSNKQSNTTSFLINRVTQKVL